jgi:allantoate deiminase
LSESAPQSARPVTTERATRVISRCRELALCSEVEGQITRPFLTPSMHRVHALFTAWMQAAGMQVHIDAAGNLRGVLPSVNPAVPRLVIGSHLDTVTNAGAFDGILGVVMGLALVEEICRESALPFAIEVIGFSEEEGVCFGKPFLGSLALIGELDSATLALADRDGITVADAIHQFGLDPADLPAAVLNDSTFGYLEFHIEQGPVLESVDLPLGVVDAIAGQSRMQLSFTGQSNHAGTTPMGALRHDALAAAAQWIAEVERYANQCPGLVATVGKLEVPGGTANVIAGRAAATLDVRHAQDATRSVAVQHYLDYAQTAARARGVTFAHSTSLEQDAVPMDPTLTTLLEDAAARATGLLPRRITSGAGHDAMILARRVPAAMLFLRSPGGLSHHPDEAIIPADVETALATGVEFLRRLRDDRAMFERVTQPHTSRLDPEVPHA